MPRPPAEAGILLERDAEGRAVAARITWQNVMGEEPESATVSFDGRPIPMDALRRVKIPPHSPDVVHVVTVELDFESGLRSRDDVAFGGGAGGEAQSELTAVPIRMTKKRKLDAGGVPRDVLRAGEEPLRVVTAEEGPASLWIVRDESATEAYGKLSGLRRRPARAGGAAAGEGRRGQFPLAASAAPSGGRRSDGALPFRGRPRPLGRRASRFFSRTSPTPYPKGSFPCTRTPSRSRA